MKIKVLYHSRAGSTKKIAEAIAKAVGANPELITDNTSLDCADLLFIGDGVYAGKADAKTEKFIKTLDPTKINNATVFGTYGSQTSAITKIKELLKKQGINVTEETFGCKGKYFFVFNRKHPDINDIDRAKTFAKRVVKNAK